ncbi:dihydrofolate reductase family protein [Qipengyuania sp. ASV99]|uniref:dihydrofolate reductase family protein n=1 Tax=Qipengyuania sp. ASV99 TaxID=3399681 RepID=UPI003A4C5373
MARHITAAAFVSLDGVMQAPGGPTEDPTGGFDEGGWVFKLWDEGIDDTLGTLFSGEYDLLLGRRTYDIFAAYWPYADGENAAMGEAFDRANKYVLTAGNQPLEWQNSHRLGSIDDIAALKATDGPKLIIQGSSTLYPSLLAAGLIDTLITMTYPVILGAGKRLMGNGTPVSTMTMTEHKVTAKGTVIATYTPGGALPPYPSQGPIPITSERELARQARIANGLW